MNKTQQLHDLGQSLWLDNITRLLLDDDPLRRYIEEFSITGLTSNPTIFDHAIGATDTYDDAIRANAKPGQSTEFAIRGAGVGGSAPRGGSLPRHLTLRTASMAGFQWKSRRCWLMTL